MVACVSTAGSSCASDGLMRNFCKNECPTALIPLKPNVDCFNMPSGGNSNLMDPENNSSSNIWSPSPAFKGISGSEACPIDPVSVSGAVSDICEHLSSDYRHSGSRNLDILKSQKENCTGVTTAEVTETHEENAVCTHRCTDGNRVEDSDSNKSPSSCKFDCIADDSSSITKTIQSGTDIPPFNQLQQSLSSQVAETESGEQNLSSSDSSELKDQGCNEKREESAGGDVLIQAAAELLIHISLGSSNEIENERRHEPQHSLDSYESIVLKLKESSVDDYCVSSKPLDLNELDDKDSAVKLRRGRRLKDFQRDILPGLASLSRHEIREDINIMEAVIRSREYKRMRSKMGDGGKWFAPVKSRRSKLNLVGRRYYS